MTQFIFRKRSGLLRAGLSTLMLAGGLGLLGAAWAEPPGKHGEVRIADVEARISERFAALDSNADGLLSAAEFHAGDGLPDWGPGHGHGRWGGNGCAHRSQHNAGDAKLTEEQRAARRQAMQAMRDSHRKAMAGALFDRLDSDGNGQLSRSEADPDRVQEARQAMHRERLFTRLDQDADGVINRTEATSHLERLRQLDADANGVVTRDEFRSARQGGPLGGAGGRPAPPAAPDAPTGS